MALQLLSPHSKALSIPILSPFAIFTCAVRLLLFSSLLFSPLVFAASHASQKLPSTKHRPCIHDHFSALLRLKQSFDPYTSDLTLSSWNASNKDCCTWHGIRCDASTSHVVSLDLSDGETISGGLDWGSLLRLRSLQQLSVFWDYYYPSPFPSGLDQLVNLTRLSLFHVYGQIPQEISSLKNLVSLELSGSGESMPLKLGNSTFLAMGQNLSSLEEVLLRYVVMSAQSNGWGESLSALPNLRKLRMPNCNLSGPIHHSLSRLHFLSELDLSYNNLSSAVPTFIANFSSLTILSLIECGLHGKFPAGIFNLPNLSVVEINWNPELIVSFPEFTRNNSLQSLILSETGFHGELPHSLGDLKELYALDAAFCNLCGPLPSSLINLTSLVFLNLSYNFLSGSLPSSYTNELGILLSIDLSYNMLGGTIPSLFFFLPSLTELHLESNQFNGFASEFRNKSFSPLLLIYLQHNNLQGPIPRYIFQLKELLKLDLSSNNFSGTVDLSLFSQLKSLELLSLSDNRYWSVQDGQSNSSVEPFPRLMDLSLHSCNINRFPNVLRKVRQIAHLDLSNNKIKGKIPQWLWTLGRGNFAYLNLSHNELEGFSQPCSNLSLSSWDIIDLSFNKLEGSIMIPPQSTLLYSLANNLFSGEVPSIICSLTALALLDLSHNHFGGSIPPCLGEISDSLLVLNLQGNAFHGNLNLTFKQGCSLKTIDASRNYLEGQVPASMANCASLELLNLRDNQIHDTFPSWLEKLPWLRVLVLGSNKFYGAIGLNVNELSCFLQLQIFDISSNSFTGSLPMNIFNNSKGMKADHESFSVLSREVTPTNGSGPVLYQNRVTVVLKGTELELEKILVAFTLIDLSNNKFHGSIPKSLGDLRSLRSLNMSNNGFTGPIPATVGNLSCLETLDLSQNSLSGEIPPQLTKLNFLAVLNLSHNQLEGQIPKGQQFSTFSNDSFLSNLGLCGLPLSRKCAEANIPPKSRQKNRKFDWDFLWSGFAVGNGVGVGLFFWTLVLWTKGRRNFIVFIDKVLLFIFPSGVFSPIHRR